MKNGSLWITAVTLLVILLAATGCPSEPAPPVTPTTPEPSTPPDEVTPQDNIPAETAPLPEEPAAEPTPGPEATGTVIAADFEETLNNHFGFMPAMLDFAAARESGGVYDRPHFELFQWDAIEREPGIFDFHETDHYMQEAQEHGLHILANIQPFAVWDQAACHRDLPPANNPAAPGLSPTKGAPCDMAAYGEFVTRLVERYDGDGVDDMPGLTYPIKHWEVMNEPEFSTGELIFFQGNAADYFEILKVTHEAIKHADPEALVVQGGMAGMMDIDIKFWQEVFDLGGAEYFDVLNMHSIGHGEHLNIPAFSKFLADNGITGKPVWVTEVQYQQSHQTQNYSNEDFAKILARSYVYALAHRVDKLFYVNIRMPSKSGGEAPPFDERSALITDDGEKSALFYAHLTVADVLGELSGDDVVAIIREKVGDWHIDEGQYRFTIGGKTVYALWGAGTLPAEITGEVRVIDITGAEETVDSAGIRLTDSPIFILVD